jgi:hypothetical protein
MARNIEKLVLDTLKNPNEVFFFIINFKNKFCNYSIMIKGSIIFPIVNFRTLHKLKIIQYKNYQKITLYLLLF